MGNYKETEKLISELATATAPLFEQADTIPADMAAELYDMYEDAVKNVTKNRAIANLELRETLCGRMDVLLEIIVDNMPALPAKEKYKDKIICTPAMEPQRWWNNADLMKDSGLTGYLLGKEMDMNPVMLYGTKPEDYPYLKNLPGLEMHYTDKEPGEFKQYYDYMSKNYQQMDAIAFYGMYNESINFLYNYRNIRPDGKVYCALDMHGIWMNKIEWTHKLIVLFGEQCDVVAAACRSLRDALNLKPEIAFSCRWMTNGFYNPMGIPVIANADEKENIILTVGRLGTWQKNNEEMLLAFAGVSDVLKDWSLRLVGTVEPEYERYIEEYFRQFPDLKNKVIFTGPITDKEELYKEYAKAKIFALTSRYEGFPNVYAEALYHGCMFVTSDIDAADDMTDNGQLGIKYKMGDVNALKDSLVKMCSNADKTAFEKHIPKALAYAGKYYDWNRNAKKLAYMLFKQKQISSDRHERTAGADIICP